MVMQESETVPLLYSNQQLFLMRWFWVVDSIMINGFGGSSWWLKIDYLWLIITCVGQSSG